VAISHQETTRLLRFARNDIKFRIRFQEMEFSRVTSQGFLASLEMTVISEGPSFACPERSPRFCRVRSRRISISHQETRRLLRFARNDIKFRIRFQDL